MLASKWPNGRSVKLPVMENTAISLVVARWFYALAVLLNSYMSRQNSNITQNVTKKTRKFYFLYFFFIFFSGQYEIYFYMRTQIIVPFA